MPELDEVLNNPIWYSHFMEFAKNSICSENLYFIKVIENLEGSNSLYKKYKIPRIVDKYIRATGERELNIEGPHKSQILRGENVEKTLIELKKVIRRLTKDSTLRDFYKSPIYEKAKIAVDAANSRKILVETALEKSGLI